MAMTIGLLVLIVIMFLVHSLSQWYLRYEKPAFRLYAGTLQDSRLKALIVMWLIALQYPVLIILYVLYIRMG